MDEYTKAAILVAVRSKTMSRDVALQRYTLSSNEFSMWERAYDDEGVVGLRDRRLNVNAGENVHRRAGVKMHHGWTGEFLRKHDARSSIVTANSAFQFDR